MPSVFLPSSGLVLPGYARRAAAAVLMCFLGLLLSLGASPMLWVVFAAAIFVVAALCDGGGGGGGGAEGARMGPVAHFGFPAEFQLVNEEKGETAGIGERPQVCACARCLLCTTRSQHASSYPTERSIVLLGACAVYIYHGVTIDHDGRVTCCICALVFRRVRYQRALRLIHKRAGALSAGMAVQGKVRVAQKGGQTLAIGCDFDAPRIYIYIYIYIHNIYICDHRNVNK